MPLVILALGIDGGGQAGAALGLASTAGSFPRGSAAPLSQGQGPPRLPPVKRTILSISSPTGSPILLSVGDSMEATAKRLLCFADECDFLIESTQRPVRSLWKSDEPKVALVRRNGAVIAQGVGRTTVRARAGRLRAEAEVHVFPSFDRMSWRVTPAKPSVGDTVAIELLLLRKSRVVGTTNASMHIGGTGMTGEVSTYASARGTIVTVSAPGQLVLVGRVGSRVDTLRLTIK